jgi:hypothetical protein
MIFRGMAEVRAYIDDLLVIVGSFEEHLEAGCRTEGGESGT